MTILKHYVSLFLSTVMLIFVQIYCRILFDKFLLDYKLYYNHIFQKIVQLNLFLNTNINTTSIFFAAEDDGRTEDPTERRKSKEREKGRVAKSQEIPSSLVALGCLLVLFFSAGFLLERIEIITTNFLGNFTNLPTNLDTNSFKVLLIRIAVECAIILGPILFVAVLMGIIGNVAQVGFLFSLKPIAFDFSRISFSFSNLIKKVIFSKQIAFNLVKTIVKIVAMLFISYLIIDNSFLFLLKTGSMSINTALHTLGSVTFKLSIILILILLATAIPDYFYQKYEFMESLKMTKQELKEEFKESEGNPLVKQRQRKMAYDLARRNVLANVRQADVVITNPTHFAVVLRYAPDKENAPRLLAKGEDHLALLIKNLARKENIPIIENKPLAREIFFNVEEGQIVPEQFL